MGKQIQLSIADPCHENWDQMTAAEQGRFCASCQKQVVDFTNMTDAQVAAFFKKPSIGSVCGRLYDDQLNRNIQAPRKTIPWIKYFFQVALPAFLMSAKASAQGKVIEKNKEVVTVPMLGYVGIAYNKPSKKLTLTNLKEIVVTGNVIDNGNNPVPFASVMIKNSKSGVPADSNGVFKLEKVFLDKSVILEVSSVGYETKQVTITEQTDVTKELVIQLTPVVLNEVVVVTYPIMGALRVRDVRTEKINNQGTDAPVIKPPAEKPAMIKVYPNPVLSGTAINIGCEKLEEGYYSFQLFSQSGQQIESKQVWIDAEARIMNMEIPSVASGNYMLTLIHKETGKRFSEKVIVQ